MDNKKGDSDFKIGNKVLPFYPVFRAGAHYELQKYTHLRASFGQGIRYPSVGERFTSTSVGALNIFPNPTLKPETGWAAEIGIKQGVKMGETERETMVDRETEIHRKEKKRETARKRSK